MTYPSSTVDRSLTFRTSYNFIIGRSYNIRLDAGIKVTYYIQSVQLSSHNILLLWIIRCRCGCHILWIEFNSYQWQYILVSDSGWVILSLNCIHTTIILFLLYVQLCVSVGWWGWWVVVAMTLRAEWRCVLTEAGGRCVTMDGTPLMPEYSVDNSISPPLVRLNGNM